MYAVIREGGKQFKVQEGDIIKVPKRSEKEGKKITIKDVLLISDDESTKIGNPIVKSAKVEAKVLKHGKDKKIIVFKYKRRKGYRRKLGHRQQFTQIEIGKILTA
jgi:large subunit ribosomal protein L21